MGVYTYGIDRTKSVKVEITRNEIIVAHAAYVIFKPIGFPMSKFEDKMVKNEQRLIKKIEDAWGEEFPEYVYTTTKNEKYRPYEGGWLYRWDRCFGRVYDDGMGFEPGIPCGILMPNTYPDRQPDVNWRMEGISQDDYQKWETVFRRVFPLQARQLLPPAHDALTQVI
jgi:hypothetical protein